jgi:aspartate/methionine/tyrosine aminotransferase
MVLSSIPRRTLVVVFSSRLPARIEPNAFSRALGEVRAAGVRLLDLTQTNPTVVGLTCPDEVWAALADAGSARYEPEPLGHLAAREAVAGEYGGRCQADRICLTASTSEAYALLFKLLCDPEDEVLVPTPSYPLFDLLTRLEAVRPVPYRLDLHGGWSIDRAGFDAALSARTRAVLVVSPNNPTGSRLHDDDREWLVSVAARRGLAIVADEVFADYPLQPVGQARSLAGEERALVFTLGGLSKSAGLPQLKLAWVLGSGPESLIGPAMTRLELIADTYLSVSTPVQRAARRLLFLARSRRQQIASRLALNLQALRTIVADAPALTVLPPEGGWSVVVRVPAWHSEEEWVLRLLQDASVVVHPGYFFDFGEEAFLILSLLPEPEVFAEGVRRLARLAAGVRP